MNFNKPTYIVLDLEEPLSSEMIKIRSKLDSFRASLPAEITVTGSSGNGAVSKDQDYDEFINEISLIAKEINPFTFSFSESMNFPSTSIYVMTVNNKDIFERIHERFKKSKISFEKSPFPYFPHCTISSKTNIAENEIELIKNLKIEGTHAIKNLSVYQLENDELDKIYTVKLGN